MDLGLSDVKTKVRESVRDALELCSSCEEPFLVLREAGVVAQIRGSLLARLSPAHDKIQVSLHRGVPARAIPGNFSWRHTPDSAVNQVTTLRVQLEMRAFEGELEQRRALKAARTDLVVLKDEAELYCWPDGPGDVVSLVKAKHVASFVEVKASPSFNLGEVGRYGNDIHRLLEVLEASQRERPDSELPSAFFVLLDKSLSRFGSYASATAQHMNWGGEDESDRCLSSVIRGHSKARADGKVARDVQRALELMRIDLTNTQPDDTVPYVEVLMVNSSGGKEMRRFAKRRGVSVP